MKKITIGAFFMLSSFAAIASDNAGLNMQRLNTEMDKAASRASISLACGSAGKKMIQELVFLLKPGYESIDYIAPNGFDVEKALGEVTAPLRCRTTVLKEIRSGRLSIEEALATASRGDL